uniref:Uncharacterized protein n=1 Tax=Corethron hystrix TaxID=216773 RepID=A0A7S1G0J7_9STRA|mmetsp:Transcript_41409/g.97023  ORF Transcript_41409/g.97023 Transcript_41409/m.97023 type:complete len:203 (+) Transcript_41409:321-929(+)|eukprot:CAMPEP_0113317984 /NCGR_PEP_ID=MMETSP0010_2-20120614/12710_1 /TAXON_ID=216773 ORGANISM="Corethron hystrix, Strain 308" /NCGR_SAMPLE_ID=MMETSP0010_2 /ASSEMBLY_ACC=CAM_ASM_000155 /LENGTH=202 /DNA_ID=CAMNT_0000175147 /DNA_START=203 /DNA_END=811 /DNA_ORIENTATION=- /assembly_acc=CAM_ASM_000155
MAPNGNPTEGVDSVAPTPVQHNQNSSSSPDNTTNDRQRDNVNAEGTPKKKNAAVHFLPCNIEMPPQSDDAAAVRVFFRVVPLPAANGQDSPALASQLRGRGLVGKRVRLRNEHSKNGPKIVGVAVAGIDREEQRRRHKRPRTDSAAIEETIPLQVDDTFDEVAVWEHGRTVEGSGGEGNSAVHRALDWCEVSCALHDPVNLT